MYKLKSGEEITINEIPKDFIRKKTDIDGKHTSTRIIRALIIANKPLRLYEITNKTGMSKERILKNLKKMISIGYLVMKEHEGVKYYVLQPIYWNNDIMYGMYERTLPFLSEINEEIDRSQTNNPNIVLDNLQMVLALFNYNIEEIKDIKRE